MPEVITVRGPIPPEDVGFALPHEHFFLDLFSWPGAKLMSGAMGVVDPVLHWDTIVQELEEFKEAGGRTIVDMTLDTIGRNPEALKRLSETTGVNIVMGCGWYRHSFHPPHLEYTPTDQLAEELVREFEEGARGTGVRPGIIGEIGIEAAYPTASEERAFRAAARAHLRTGLSVTTHTSIVRGSGLDALQILLHEGVPPERIIIGHADSYPQLDYLLALLSQGCYVQFDCIAFVYQPPSMQYSDVEMADLTIELVQRGYADRLLLSHDICNRSVLKRYGGDGYTCLHDRFLPLLREKGVEDEVIDLITAENVRRVLEV
jgi:phosphotriesterase-related protein